jgi:hypothetical protein
LRGALVYEYDDHDIAGALLAGLRADLDAAHEVKAVSDLDSDGTTTAAVRCQGLDCGVKLSGVHHWTVSSASS